MGVPKLAAAETRKLDDYEAEDDHRTISRAHEIQQDPKRLQKVRRHHRRLTRTLRATGRTLAGRALAGKR